MPVDTVTPRPTEAFVLPTNRKFYPAHIPPEHWQLRQLISSPSKSHIKQADNIVYYTSESCIYSLNTSTQKRERIASLPFPPRCLTADHGWICAGGEDDGQFAAVRLGDDDHDDYQSPRRATEVDALLPLDLDPVVRHGVDRNITRSEGHGRQSRSRRTPVVRVEELGGSIVNSVTISAAGPESIASDEGPVAVLTNNDKTVRIYHLPSSRLLHTLQFHTPMNHASLSPDGKLLASVGDVSPTKTPVVYFHRKVVDMEASLQFDPQTNERMSYYIWEPCANTRLDPGLDSSFCTSFSSSGRLCAIGSQDSTIVIYDTRYLDDADQDPVTAILRSSRPGTEHGAVRSLRFCPGPWDLLIWTEHTGRACIADVRDGCRSRQTLELRANDDDTEVVDTGEQSPASHLIDPQLRDTDDADFYWRYRRYVAQGNEAAASNFAADYNEASAERRRLQRQTREESPSDFSEREREIFDALRSSRGDAGLAEGQGISINYLSPPRQRSQERSTAPLAIAEAYINSSRDLAAATPSSIRDFIRSERHQDHDRQRRRTFEPRRQASMFLSPPRGTSSALPIARTSSTVTSSSLATNNQGDATDPWRTIEAAMAPGALIESSNRILNEREAEIEESFRRHQDTALRWGQRRSEGMITQLEHQRAQEIQARLELRRRERRRREQAAPSSLYGDEHEHPFFGPATSGSAMTPDGRRLYIGIAAGILEFQMNLSARKFFPELTPI